MRKFSLKQGALVVGSSTMLALTGACATSSTAASTDTTAHPASSASMNTLTSAEQAQGWRLLFDGKTTNGWHGFRRTDVPAGWQAVDGELRRVAQSGDLVTSEQFQNFDLTFEWKIGYGGNSGVMYHVTDQGNETYETGPEYQLLDDPHYPDGKSLLTSAGSDFGLYAIPRHLAKPANEWNTSRIIVNGAHVEHWLNGVKAVEYDLWSPDWKERVAKSKFRMWPNYGLAKQGYIALQDHEFPVAFRNIKIRVLP